MKLLALLAALALAAPVLAAPTVVPTSLAAFAKPVTVALTSSADGQFKDRPQVGQNPPPRPPLDASNPGEQFRYEFKSRSTVEQFSWTTDRGQLDCTFEFTADPGVTFISLDLEKDVKTFTQNNVKGHSLQTNCVLIQ